MLHQWLQPIAITNSADTSAMRMCGRCGLTQVLERGSAPPIWDWFEVEGGVIGDNCETMVVAAPTTTELGYTIPGTQG